MLLGGGGLALPRCFFSLTLMGAERTGVSAVSVVSCPVLPPRPLKVAVQRRGPERAGDFLKVSEVATEGSWGANPGGLAPSLGSPGRGSGDSTRI